MAEKRLGRGPWSLQLQVFALVATDLAVGMRVVPQVLGFEGGAWDAVVALSGVLAYAGLAAFAANAIRTVRAGASVGSPNGLVPLVPIAFR